ncbi:protein of unknown function DUF1568 [Pirellula staleyi DSM 6068]|uniref:Transposase IS200-like domain-containing protein n=1 Tax=Pirellula staleyi (strain ATCC 27377 / DSM 6068 / ICPB 4128) TaxID=530564 RepID=D2R8C3_PIRSD|nr:transposase [Pirellula staleyi]ADB15740.1 protein of unknown function DUF1568 [Pirellula staleyi DSM 6068]
MPSLHRKQVKRYDIPGDVRFLTFSCFQRLPLLSRDRTRIFLVEAIERCRSLRPFELWGYVIMPEHVHLIILPGKSMLVAEILKTIKVSTSKRAITWLHQNAPDFLHCLEDLQPNGSGTYRFWQRGGGYDRNLRSTRDVHEKLSYIHENPVRRGLVLKAEDWKWSSALAWQTGIDEPLRIDRENVPRLDE